MNKFIEKHWLNLLGGTFLFTAFLYFFKLAIEEGWLPPAARVAIGMIAGATGLYYGYVQYKKKSNLSAELLAGLGSSIVYATLAYASFSKEILWSTNALFISTLSFSSLITFIGLKYDMRKLVLISILGGLISPLVLKAPEEQVFILFLYVFILNAVALYLSVIKNWPELRIISFVVTAIIYITYYIYFDPLDWKEPIFYVSTLFVVYFFGLMLASVYESNNFEGLNLYLGLINAINFIFWSIFILNTFSVPYALPTLFVALLYLFSSAFIYAKAKGSSIPPAIYFILGIVLIAIASSDLASYFNQGGMHYVINASIWLMLILVIFITGTVTSIQIGRNISLVLWFLVLIYWYSVAWEVEWVRWFGVEFIPFLNPGALVWIGMAISGFIFSHKIVEKPTNDDKNESIRSRDVSLTLSIASHLVVGGLLTIQIQNTWDAYDLQFMTVGVFLSLSWMIYALLIFTWGAYSNQKIFRILGSLVIGITSLKVFFLDLTKPSTIYIVMLLLIIGVIILTIARIDKFWREKHGTDGIKAKEKKI